MYLETEQHSGKLADFIKKEMKGKPILYRLTGEDRIYFTKSNYTKDALVYNSGTTLIHNYRDINGEVAIKNWEIDLINKGKDPKVELTFRQDYGTLLHILYGYILEGVSFNIENLDNSIIEFSSVSRIPKERVVKVVKRYSEEFKKDVLALLKWIADYNIDPLGVELMLKSDEWQVATALDLICMATVNVEADWGAVFKSGPRKGQPKLTKKPVRKLIIVDFKSGKKGFYDKNVLQLKLSKEIFEENFPNIKVEGIYNFAPKDWKKEPTYTFQNHDRTTNDHVNYLSLISKNVFERGQLEFNNKILTKKRRVYFGKISIESPYENYTRMMSKVDLANYHYDLHNLSNSDFVDIYKTNNFKDVNTFINSFENVSDKELTKICNKSKVFFQSREDLFRKLSQLNYGAE